MFARGPRRRLSFAASLGVWLVLGALWALNRTSPAVGPIQHASYFLFIVDALIWIGQAVAAAGTYIAVTLEVFVQYVWTVVGWLTRRVADILANTGSMFARVWESARLFYDDVLRPALVWLHDFYEQARAWLTNVMAPILDWAKRVKDELQALYKRFVRPVLDGIDTARKILDILTKLHVPFAQQLDQALTEVEQTIISNYLKILGVVNKTIDTINGILTLDGYLQRFLFLRTMQRDIAYVARVWWNSQLTGMSKEDADAARALKYEGADVAQPGRDLGDFYANGDGAYAGIIGELAPQWFEAAGLSTAARSA